MPPTVSRVLRRVKRFADGALADWPIAVTGAKDDT